MNNFLVGIAGFICTILLGAIFVPYFVDWNSFKTEIEAAGRQITGQNVQIIGDVELRILPQPVFHTGGLIITNADEKKLLETNDFILELDFPSLLRGKVEVTSMHLNEGKIYVAKADNASLNMFNFGGSIGQPIGLDDISIKKLLLNHMDVEFTNELTNSHKTVSINQAEVTARSLIGPFKMKGTLDVDANDTVYQRQFLVSVGKYTAEKPLTVKLQIEGEKKGSRLSFLGNLVGLETQPLLTGKLSVKGKKGEDLIGYGQNFGSTLSDDLSVTSELSVNYSGVKIDNLKIDMGTKNNDSLDETLKLTGEFNYVWGRKPRLDGALNVGVANFDYVKRQFLAQADLDADAAVYQSFKQLSTMAQKWIREHLVISLDAADDNPTDFTGDVSFNVEQLGFLQNNVIDRVRLIKGMINIENNQISIPQFTAHFPGNGKLSYALSKQLVGQSADRLMSGQYEFSALHLSKLTNWLLFKNQNIDNIHEFWSLNDQLTSKGNVDVLLDGLKISSPLVRSRNHNYALDYSYSDVNQLHDVDVGFDRVSFDNDDLADFQKYIGSYAQAAFVPQAAELKTTGLDYHLLPVEMIKNIGNVRLNLHGNESFYGIRDLGVFDATLTFKPDAVELEKFSLIGEKIYLTAQGGLPHKYAEKSIIDAEKNKAILEFSIVDADMNIAPQLVHNLLFEDNLFLSKSLPHKGPLDIKGRLNSTSVEGDFYVDVAGKIGTSDLNIDAEIKLNDGKFNQQNIQYQLSHVDAEQLLYQYGLAGLLENADPDVENVKQDGIVRLNIGQNATDETKRDVKFLVIAAGQNIEFTAQNTIGETLDLSGDLQLKLNGLGLVAEKTGLFNGNFNRINGALNLDAKVEILGEKINILSKSAHMLNSDFNRFELNVLAANEIDFSAQAKRFNIADLLSFLAGENSVSMTDGLSFLDDASQQTMKAAQDLFATSNDAPLGFDLKMIENTELSGKILIENLYFSDGFIVHNAEIKIRSNRDEKAVFVDYKGDFFNTTLNGEFSFKPNDNQLYMDVTLRSFGLDVEQMAIGLGFDRQYITGLVDVEIDLAGQGYSVEGLLSNLAGFIDVDLKSLTTTHIDGDYFDHEIVKAVDEAKIDQVFANMINVSNANDTFLPIKILPKKVVINVANGLASISEPIEFQKPNSKRQASTLNILLDLTTNTSQIALQVPLAKDNIVPKLRLSWLNDGSQTSEFIDFEDMKEYYKVKLLEKNVQRLEELQVEIKQKNDAEIARHQQEKFEALTFKNEIKLRVETAVNERKMREMTAKKPAVPRPMPFMFVEGISADLIDGFSPTDKDFHIVNNSLLGADVADLVETDIAEKIAMEKLAKQKAEKEARDAAKRAAAARQKLIDEAPNLELTPELDDPLFDFLSAIELPEDFIAKGGGFKTGNLTEEDSLQTLEPSSFNNSDVVKITPIPDLQ